MTTKPNKPGHDAPTPPGPGLSFANRVAPGLLRASVEHLRPYCSNGEPDTGQIIEFSKTLALLMVAGHVLDAGELLRGVVRDLSDAGELLEGVVSDLRGAGDDVQGVVSDLRGAGDDVQGVVSDLRAAGDDVQDAVRDLGNAVSELER